jgi:arylformamidase
MISEMEIYDISQTLCHGIAVWPGDPEFKHRRVSQIDDETASNVSAVDMCVHTGTHVDAPFHFERTGKGVETLPPSSFMGPARVFSLAAGDCVRAADLCGLDWANVERVLFKTRGSRHAESTFNRDYVHISYDAAEFLVERRLRLVGIDSPSVDAFDSSDFPSHRTLLRNEIVILEGVRLQHVQPGDYELICLPLKIAGADGSPVRAILRR